MEAKKEGWEMVKLGEVLKQVKYQIKLLPEQTYKQVTIKMNRKGVTLRGLIQGSQVGSNQYIAKSNQFIISKIDARNGAYGIVPKELESAIVTGDFVLFDQSEHLDVSFLNFFANTRFFDFECKKASEGTTNRVRLKIEKFLQIEIPLPPLSEQQHIAGRLAALKGKIDRIKSLREGQEKINSAFRNGLFKQICRDYEMVILNKILTPRKEVVAVEPQKEYNQITVKMQHKGVILRGVILGGEVGSVQLRAKEGDFIISKIDARNGAMGIVPKALDNAIVTNDFPLFSFSSECLPKFFEFVSNTEYFDQKCIQSSEGTTNRVRLKMERFSNIEIPLPPLAEQKRVVEILEKMDALKTLKAGQLSVLEGLFPGVLEQAFRGEW